MLRTLILKDFRLSLSSISMVAGSVVASFLLSAFIFCNESDFTKNDTSEFWSVLLMSGAYFSAFASMPTIAILSGSVLASERADRSIEFLSILPPTRTQIFGSKLILVSAVCLTTLWIILSSIATANALAGDSILAATVVERFPSIQWIVAANFLNIAVGLSASCFSKNSALCALLAFFSPLALQINLLIAQKKMGLFNAFDALYVFLGSCILLGSLTLTIGWQYFKRNDVL